MDFPMHVDIISMKLPILYFKGSKVEISKLWCISVTKNCFCLWNSGDPDEKLHYAAFNLGLLCLPKYLFADIQNEKARVRTDLGKVLEFDLGPGKLLEFEQSAFCPGIVLEFCKIILESLN